jgi:DNA modification methylase
MYCPWTANFTGNGPILTTLLRFYDPFSGSGSTLVACEQLGRVGYGCEIDAGYVAVTLERLAGMGLKPERM